MTFVTSSFHPFMTSRPFDIRLDSSPHPFSFLRLLDSLPPSLPPYLPTFLPLSIPSSLPIHAVTVAVSLLPPLCNSLATSLVTTSSATLLTNSPATSPQTPSSTLHPSLMTSRHVIPSISFSFLVLVFCDQLSTTFTLRHPPSAFRHLLAVSLILLLPFLFVLRC